MNYFVYILVMILILLGTAAIIASPIVLMSSGVPVLIGVGAVIAIVIMVLLSMQ